MGRLHLFEFEDQPWCPAVLRDGGTAYITKVTEVGGLLGGTLPQIRKLVEARPGTRLLDLCGGAGGPAALVAEALDVEVHCTDLFPNTAALAFTASRVGERFTWSREPVDATAVPDALRGPRVLFNGFHHFRPPDARRILEDAVAAGDPIGVFEFVGRQPLAIPGMLGLPLAVMALVPFLRPFHWAWIPLTYVVPLLPAIVVWDGMVSCLRVYSPAELQGLVEGLDAYDWDIGTFPLPVAGHGTYLVGTPKPAG